MAGSTPPPRIPLPRGWPRTIRSAVIHAISLAQFSLAHTRSWAANNWNARIRLKQENDRLRQEVAILIKEMRIKDARMLQITAQRRPLHRSAERGFRVSKSRSPLSREYPAQKQSRPAAAIDSSRPRSWPRPPES